MDIHIIFILLFAFILNAKGTNQNKGIKVRDPNTQTTSTVQGTTFSFQNNSNQVPCSVLHRKITRSKRENGGNFPQLNNNITDSLSMSDSNIISYLTFIPSTDNQNTNHYNLGHSIVSTTTPFDSSTTSTTTKLFGNLKLDLTTILIFLMGVICSTFIFSTVFCFVMICTRCKTTDATTDKECAILEAVKSEHDQFMIHSDEDQADEQAPLQVQSPVGVSTNTSAINSGTEDKVKILGKDKTEEAGEVKEVAYASINFSLLQKKGNGDLNAQKVESDYAEIQLKKPSEGEDGETLQDGEKQGEVKEHGVKQDGEDQDGLKQDAMDQGLEGGMESQIHVELEEVQV